MLFYLSQYLLERAAAAPGTESLSFLRVFRYITVRSATSDSPAIALYPSRALALFDGATAYARESFSDQRPIHEAAMELTGRIHADFVYDPGSTEVSTPAHEAFDRG